MNELTEKRGRGRPKGLPKTGGIQKGGSWDKNVAMRNNIRLFINQNYDKMVFEWNRIEDPAQKVKLYLEALKFVLPQMRSVEFKGENEKTTLEAKLLLLVNKTVKGEKEIEDADSEEISEEEEEEKND